ncbi:MHS family proline/betaine transporter-like MFS transporter [Sphingomonas abaci]|uniref:MHS family proline/betaine transporter-like MFS transporter n=2 Tax=Sphingomonas abaci TaxID=237611 RepID=A0A7W7EXA0_9SPHN|nr:MHS family proline/betaine transporter-like MFS transporter [Sphingomonas abaci]
MSRRSMAVAALSTVVEWYDFTLYLYLATVLSRVFYGGGAVAVGTTLAGFALAYLMRPLGAIAFGHIGDRYGRRRMMLLSMAVMTAAMLATALLPTRDQIGPAAGWLLLLLRCVMAFSVGGEYTGVVAYLLEGARPERRGLVTSTAAAASEVGGLLAAAVAALTVGAMGVATLDQWGWRIPFLIGAGLAAAVWLARSTMQESPEFERQAGQGSVPANPLRMSLAQHRTGILRGFAISALGSITYYVGITYVPAFLTETGGVGEAMALWLSTGAALVVVLVTPLVGLLTDRIGRRPVLLGLCGAAALLPAALFGMMASGGLALAVLGTMILAMLGGGVSAVGAVATAEQFPGEGRLTGLALGVTSATAIFGGLAPYVAHRLIAWTGSPLMPGLMIAVVALGLLPVLVRMNETRPG